MEFPVISSYSFDDHMQACQEMGCALVSAGLAGITFQDRSRMAHDYDMETTEGIRGYTQALQAMVYRSIKQPEPAVIVIEAPKAKSALIGFDATSPLKGMHA